ncbi:MAG: T9SS type A sorting domain-containing protein [Ignavibacteriales bacterium]|nr:T9SS type A sorting domain-containing protein [Ignavibacteriales bacterium]MBI3788873.1 T9SS type A sorting domain-containing protein [Ignavibacteriales bacterium]
MKLFVAIALTVSIATAQTVYQIPFASTGNTIELAVANTSTVPLSNIEIKITNAPAWIKFVSDHQNITSLKANEKSSALFSFSVVKFAPVKQEQTLIFSVTRHADGGQASKTGESWSKEIRITVAPPERFELFQNYPNPFNPTTTINYQLSSNNNVSLKIFNLLGQEVATLVNSEKPAGYHQEQFDAHTLASGMYAYQLSIADEQGNKKVSRKTMVLLK